VAGRQQETDDRADHADRDGGAVAVRDSGGRADGGRRGGDENLEVGLRIMAGENIMRECTTCKSRNYFTTKTRRKHPERAEWKKYCPRCNKQTAHKESK